MADDYPGNATNEEHLQEGESIIEPLPEDNAAPFSPPTSPVSDTAAPGDESTRQTPPLEPTHQATDSATNIDTQQLYDEGLAGAAEASEPNSGNAVAGYDPANDQRRTASDDEEGEDKE